MIAHLKNKSKISKKLYTICKEVRENFCKKHSFLWEDDLRGCCCDISADLYIALKQNGYKAKIIIGECYGSFHLWVECKNKILDLSIKQFESLAFKRLPEIYIEKISTSFNHKKRSTSIS